MPDAPTFESPPLPRRSRTSAWIGLVLLLALAMVAGALLRGAWLAWRATDPAVQQREMADATAATHRLIAALAEHPWHSQAEVSLVLEPLRRRQQGYDSADARAWLGQATMAIAQVHDALRFREWFAQDGARLRALQAQAGARGDEAEATRLAGFVAEREALVQREEQLGVRLSARLRAQLIAATLSPERPDLPA